MIFSVSDGTFNDGVIERSRSIPVVLVFTASWCVPCKKLKAVINDAIDSGEITGVEFALADVDECDMTSSFYRVMKVPTVYGFINGEPVCSSPTVSHKTSLLRFIDTIKTQ